MRRKLGVCLGGAALLYELVLLGNIQALGQVSTAPSECYIDQRSKCPGAHLSGAKLKGQYMAMMDLSGAKLAGADLQAADLWKANLADADLSHANLADAFLTGAYLRGADLSGADLRRAFIFGAFAEGARFDGASLEGARWLSGAICGAGSIGTCQPVPADASVAAPLQSGPPGGAYPGAIRPVTASITDGKTIVAHRDEYRYSEISEVNIVLPADKSKAKPTDGAVYAAITFIPVSAASILEIHVTANFYADKEIDAVLAVFRKDEPDAVYLKSIRVPAGKRVTLDDDFRSPAKASGPINFEFRVGPAQPGSFLFNGPRGDGPSPVSLASVSADE